jgi:hypothetical protein
MGQLEIVNFFLKFKEGSFSLTIGKDIRDFEVEEILQPFCKNGN